VEPAVGSRAADAPAALAAPAIRDGVVSRPGLFRRLTQARRVVQLSAPPGSGKTVLLRSWIAQSGLAECAAWVPVPGGECDPQPQYSLLAREIEWEIVPAAIDAGLGLLPWSPLGGGWLSGKYRRDQRPTGATRLGEDPGRGMEAYDRRGTDRTWAVIDAVQKIAEERSVRPGEQRAVAEQDVVDQPHVRRQRVGAVQAGQRDRRAGHVEVQRGPGLLGHQEQVDLPVAGKREGQHVPGAGPLAGQRPGRLAQDQADPLLPVCCHTATSASAGAVLRAGAQNLPAWMRRLRWDWPGTP
jgi:Aldo/keto reductase family